MAGDWIKIEMTTPDKPEVVSMAAALRTDQDAVVGKLFRIWIWADANTVCGDCVKVTEQWIDRMTNRKGFASAMRAVGWLKGVDGALVFPNFDRHNGASGKARAETNRRVANHRARNAKQTTNVTQEPLQKPLPEKRREEKRRLSTTTPTPPPAVRNAVPVTEPDRDPETKSSGGGGGLEQNELTINEFDRDKLEQIRKLLGAEFPQAERWAKQFATQNWIRYLYETAVVKGLRPWRSAAPKASANMMAPGQQDRPLPVPPTPMHWVDYEKKIWARPDFGLGGNDWERALTEVRLGLRPPPKNVIMTALVTS